MPVAVAPFAAPVQGPIWPNYTKAGLASKDKYPWANKFTLPRKKMLQ